MSKERVIGIVGGKGPEATVELLNLIIQNTSVEREEDHFRVIVDNNPKIPKPALGITGEGPCPLAAIIETARNVERAGADFLVIPCNSAHYYLEEARQAVNVPFVSIIEETAATLIRAGVGKVGLMATTGLVGSGLYQNRLAESGVEAVTPEARLQKEMMDKILRFKDTGELTPLTEVCVEIRRELIGRGAEAVAYACTEIPLALAGNPIDVLAFDTIEVLAKACVREARGTDS